MWPVHLLRAAHPLQGLLTALALAVVALADGRPGREAGLVLGTVLAGQAVLGWHDDLVDRARDAAHSRRGKPLATGRLEPATAWFALACGVLVVVPLALANGVAAGAAYLLSLAIALVGSIAVRGSALSWVPWAASYALLPAFLAYGGWGGRAEGHPPTVLVTVLAALLGVAVHFLVALPHLVDDHEDGLRHLPLRAALRIGAPRVLWITAFAGALLAASLFVAAATVGLHQRTG